MEIQLVHSGIISWAAAIVLYVPNVTVLFEILSFMLCLSIMMVPALNSVVELNLTIDLEMHTCTTQILETANQPTWMYICAEHNAGYLHPKVLESCSISWGRREKCTFSMKLKLLQQEDCSTPWWLNLSFSGLLYQPSSIDNHCLKDHDKDKNLVKLLAIFWNNCQFDSGNLMHEW